jgi:hypothetical protein
VSSVDGKFTDSDRDDVVALLDEKVLSGRSRFFGRIDGITITAASALPEETSPPEAFISRAGIVNRRPKVGFSVSGTSARDVERRLLATDMREPDPRASFGQCVYEFRSETPGRELVDFALRGLRALAADPVDGHWIYTTIKAEGE